MASAGRLTLRRGDRLSTNSACANDNVGNLFAADPPRVALIIVRVTGQKGIRNDASGATYGVDVLAHFGAASVPGGAVGRMMGGYDQRFVVLLAGNSLQGFLEPIELRL